MKIIRHIHSSLLPICTFVAAIAGMLLGACANIGTPSGGPRDEDPPIFVSGNPAPGSLNVSKEKIVLTFNELVNVKDAFQNVVVSPTSKAVPRVTSLGKRVTIEFDSLAPNTTYTVDFANAIEDNNEANPLQGFSYTFATGPVLDSLRIAGRVLGARDMEPRQGILVGVQLPWTDMQQPDTAFAKTRLLRVSKTDDRGRFTIRGLAPGEYRVFALDDKDGDYAYSSAEEDIAFMDATVMPAASPAVAMDTIYDRVTGEVDTVRERARTLFTPNDLVLRTFNSGLRQQYITKYERQDSTRMFLKFNAYCDSLPRVRLLGLHPDTYIGTLESSQKLDSLVWWLTPELMRVDSLRMIVDYVRTDQNFKPEAVSDTLNFYTKRLPVPKKKKNEKRVIVSREDSIAAITTSFKMLTQAQHDVHLPLQFEVPAPLERLDSTAIHLSVMVDSLYVPVSKPFMFSRPVSGNPRLFSVDYEWDYGGKYRLAIDSLAAVDIYGKPTRPLQHEFTVKESGEYCSLLFHLNGMPAGTAAFVELLNGSDAVVRTERVENSEVFFPFLTPGKYYARAVMDLNGNGEYDTGNYDLRLQPELAYYYPKAINVKKNWDKEEEWNLWELPVDLMKPMQITKNKPSADKRARNNRNKDNETEEEEEDYFDPTANPFDPNDKAAKRRNRTAGSY